VFAFLIFLSISDGNDDLQIPASASTKAGILPDRIATIHETAVAGNSFLIEVGG
jgi:hypothetical protein